MSMQSCQAKFPVRPASHLHCATKKSLRMSVEHGMVVHAWLCIDTPLQNIPPFRGMQEREKALQCRERL